MVAPIELMYGTKDWHQVSTSYAKFEVFLMQLAKVDLDMQELSSMVASDRLWNKRITRNSFRVFIFELEQISDANEPRGARFRRDLKQFLGLEAPLADFRDVTGGRGQPTRYAEQIDICDQQHDGLRKQLLKDGRKTATWIRNRFILSDDVVTSNGDHFNSLLGTWGVDPCKGPQRNSTANKPPRAGSISSY